ncbi:MAG TPA: hypothetical protein VMB46_00240 [Methanomassiliicoccales archaeon]|nr:hypothetical protein [Methanomassiliicoccales archaeon]
MLSGRDELAGGARLAQVRLVKRRLYLVQLAIVIIVPIIVILLEGRASLVPFYLPINSFIYFILLMALIIVVESFVFKILEMRLLRSSSAKYYIAKTSIRNGIVIIVVCAAVIFLLWAPFVSQSLENAFSTSATLVNNGAVHVSDSSSLQFYDRDSLGILSVDQLTITASGGDAVVYVVSDAVYSNPNVQSNVSLLATYRINVAQDHANPTVQIDMSGLPYGKYHAVVDTQLSSAPEVQVTVHTSYSPTFLSYVPFFALLFVIAYAGWIVYLTPMMRKYSRQAIYS